MVSKEEMLLEVVKMLLDDMYSFPFSWEDVFPDTSEYMREHLPELFE